MASPFQVAASNPQTTHRPMEAALEETRRKKKERPEASEVVEEPDDVGEVDPAVAVVVEQ